ncbi:indolepyruvate oxidoreductase subunit beta family protein [Vibrio nigripulchritudo]|uniref:indolepyruvate oxidoreductase subunit beta family protein n=1 Tax=Vibrio nigripulchritudo TaxID=28173 RepID=UPI0005FA4285|nr:indolepyruvate oxidoreductase subunit beta family protein [Vibrio nigripulchritudo]KJY68555.1 indolepyruvate oxidoreductase subunit B [Vibrio nigripulchritudo]
MNPNKPIKIAILAMGGEGGGVLADWIVHLAESNGFVAQTTSVPGVAQRTGATIYYVEMFSKRVAEKYQAAPVLALMPIPEDVDIVLTSELMEAGRAIQRSLVTPDQTLLITSTHRVYSYQERASMGDGRVDTKSLIAHAKRSSKRLIHFDMEKVAAENKSVISSVLFGALCESGALPFSKEQFEQTIRNGGVGVKESLNAFHAAGLMSATNNATPQIPTHLRNVHPLARTFPKQCQETISNGIVRLIDYQDKGYASDYVNTLKEIDLEHHPKLLNSVARHLALWLSYEDVMRVADLKVRASRFQRVRQEVGANTEQILHIEEFMHPGLDEICDSLPARLGNWVKHSSILSRLIRRWTHKGKRVRTSSLPGFLMLYLLANWKAHRRITLRHQSEKREIQTWLKRIKDIARNNPELSLEIARCQRLVKGYGDTHKRGMNNFTRLMSLSDRYIDELSPSLLRELRDAALADEHGEALKKLQARYSLTL